MYMGTGARGLTYSAACCLRSTFLCPLLKILCCLSAYQVWLSAQLVVSASLLCSFQPVKRQSVSSTGRAPRLPCMTSSLIQELACCLSDRADAHRSEEYSSRPAEKARSTTGNSDGRRASSPTGAALEVVVQRRLRPAELLPAGVALLASCDGCVDLNTDLLPCCPKFDRADTGRLDTSCD